MNAIKQTSSNDASNDLSQAVITVQKACWLNNLEHDATCYIMKLDVLLAVGSSTERTSTVSII